MLVIGHRGAAGHAPEHTFASYDRALQFGVDYLEQDLQMTRDGVLVVLHDETLDRTTGGVHRGRVIDRTLDELRACDVGSWFNAAFPDRARPEFAGQRVPTLDQVLARYGDRASFYIETKKPEEAPGMEQALLDTLRRHDLVAPAAREWRVLVQSFSEASLRLLHELEPSLPLIQLLHRPWRERSSLLRRLPRIAEYAVGIGPSWNDVGPALVKRARELCLEVHPYTVNEPAQMERLAAMGVTGMFTDYGDVLLGLRPAEERRGREAGVAAALRYRECRGGGGWGG